MATFFAGHWFVLALLFVVLICAVGQALAFDALLKYEYKFCRDQWEADGSLPGLFWMCLTPQTWSPLTSGRSPWSGGGYSLRQNGYLE
jgi:hypothetical protein